MNKKDDITEYEAKFYPVNKEEYRKKLEAIGAKLVVPERKMIRTLGDHRQNPMLPNNVYLRVRNEGNQVTLSYKTFTDEKGNLTDQKEIEVQVSDFERIVEIIELVGFKFNFKQENLREEWMYKNAQITIDSWPGLEPYSEIETDSENKVKEIAEELGFKWNHKIITPAADVYARVYKISIEEALEKLKDITFENNPFAGMETYELEYN